jgi:hypothetical protein
MNGAPGVVSDTALVRGLALDLEPTEVIVELVARNERGPEPAGDRLQLTLSDESADLVL